MLMMTTKMKACAWMMMMTTTARMDLAKEAAEILKKQTKKRTDVQMVSLSRRNLPQSFAAAAAAAGFGPRAAARRAPRASPSVCCKRRDGRKPPCPAESAQTRAARVESVQCGQTERGAARAEFLRCH